MTQMMKPLAPGEIRTATAPSGTTVTLMEVANGGFITCQVRDGKGAWMIGRTLPSTGDAWMHAYYAEQCRLHGAS